PELTPPKLPDSIREQLENSPPPWIGEVGSPSQFKEPPRLTPPPLPEELLLHGSLPPHQSNAERQLDTLERFLELPPERLLEIRRAIEKIEGLDEARKAALLETLRKNRRQPPESGKAVTPLPQNLLSRLNALPQAQRVQLQSNLAVYKTPEARAAFLEGYFHATDSE